MITALTLCGYLVSAHLATGCHAAKDPHGAALILRETGAPAMLVLDPQNTEALAASLQTVGATVVTGEWVGVVVAAKGSVPEGVADWLNLLDSAVQYSAAVSQDAAHLRDAKASGALLSQQEWTRRLGEDRTQLAVVYTSWRGLTGRALPTLPERAVQE